MGENAQGKSNLLEAIYYLETFRSFRGAKDAQLVGFDQDVFRIEGAVSGVTPSDGPSGRATESVAAAYDRKTKKKRVTVDGQIQPSLSDALGHLGAVVFSPADIRMVDGAPAERRRYVDIVLSLNRGGYVTTLQTYRQALNQRNAALKGRAPEAAIRAWDDGLARAGAALMYGRHQWIAEIADEFSGTYAAVSGGETAHLRYRSSVRPEADTEPTEETWEHAFRASLADAFDRDQRFGTTSVGPHRDELRISFGSGSAAQDQEVRAFGSGGQRRTAALALRLVEASTVRRSRGHAPIVLLDDAFAELDEARSSRLLELIGDGGMGQVILTAPKESDVRVRAEVLPRWRIEAGRIEA